MNENLKLLADLYVQLKDVDIKQHANIITEFKNKNPVFAYGYLSFQTLTQRLHQFGNIKKIAADLFNQLKKTNEQSRLSVIAEFKANHPDFPEDQIEQIVERVAVSDKVQLMSELFSSLKLAAEQGKTLAERKEIANTFRNEHDNFTAEDVVFVQQQVDNDADFQKAIDTGCQQSETDFYEIAQENGAVQNGTAIFLGKTFENGNQTILMPYFNKCMLTNCQVKSDFVGAQLTSSEFQNNSYKPNFTLTDSWVNDSNFTTDNSNIAFSGERSYILGLTANGSGQYYFLNTGTINGLVVGSSDIDVTFDYAVGQYIRFSNLAIGSTSNGKNNIVTFSIAPTIASLWWKTVDLNGCQLNSVTGLPYTTITDTYINGGLILSNTFDNALLMAVTDEYDSVPGLVIGRSRNPYEYSWSETTIYAPLGNNMMSTTNNSENNNGLVLNGGTIVLMNGNNNDSCLVEGSNISSVSGSGDKVLWPEESIESICTIVAPGCDNVVALTSSQQSITDRFCPQPDVPTNSSTFAHPGLAIATGVVLGVVGIGSCVYTGLRFHSRFARKNSEERQPLTQNKMEEGKAPSAPEDRRGNGMSN